MARDGHLDPDVLDLFLTTGLRQRHAGETLSAARCVSSSPPRSIRPFPGTPGASRAGSSSIAPPSPARRSASVRSAAEAWRSGCLVSIVLSSRRRPAACGGGAMRPAGTGGARRRTRTLPMGSDGARNPGCQGARPTPARRGIPFTSPFEMPIRDAASRRAGETRRGGARDGMGCARDRRRRLRGRPGGAWRPRALRARFRFCEPFSTSPGPPGPSVPRRPPPCSPGPIPPIYGRGADAASPSSR